METFEMEFQGRSNQLSGKKREPKPPKMKILMAGFVVYLHIVLIKYQMLLEKLGLLIVKYPTKLVVTVFLLGAVSCLGFLSRTPPDLQEELFMSEHSNLVKDFTTARKYFPVINSRHEEVILTPVAKTGFNMLSNACLKDALLVHKTVMNIENFHDVCMVVKGKRQPQNTSCMMTNPLELCDVNNENAEQCLEAIVREWINSSKVLSDGRTFKFDEQLFVKDLKVHKNDNRSKEGNAKARAIRMIYYLKNPPKSDPSEKTISSWEELFIQEMEDLRSKMTCASLYFTSFQNQDKVASLLFSYDTVAIVFTFVVLSCTCVIMVTCLMALLHPVVLILGASVTLCVALGLVSSLSASCLADVNMWQSTWIINIFIYSKGATDALILIHDMHKQRNMPSLEHRITSCITKSGMTLTTSNLIFLAVFVLAQMSSFPVFRELTLVALINIFLNYFLIMILFMACLFLCQRKFKYATILRHTAAGSTSNDTNSQEYHTREDKPTFLPLMHIYGKIVCSKPGSTLTMMLFIGLVVGCSYSALNQNEIFDSPLTLNPNDEAAKFLNIQRHFFDEKRVKIVFSGKLNYSNSDLRQKLKTFGETLSNAFYSERPTDSWISRFEDWTKLQGWRCTGSQFKDCLENFLRDPKNAFVREDLNFTKQNDTLNLVASSFHLYMISSKEFSFRKRSLESLLRDIATFQEKHNVQISVASHLLEETEQLIFVQRESIWLAITTGVTTTILSLVFTASPSVAVVLAVGLVGQVLELMTLMHLWDVSLNYASIICVSLGFIVSMNFSVQMSQIRALSIDNTAKKRTMDALNSGGMAILFGGILAILSSIGLGFIYPNLALIFHRVLPIHFVLGVFHSLGYIPAALLITSKPVEACTRAMVPPVSQLSELLNQKKSTPVFSSCRQSRPSGVAILGISCRFPNAENKGLFWDMLINGKSGFHHDYPANRPGEQKEYHMLYNPKRFTKGRLCAIGGAYLNNIRDFDADFFNISSQEAKVMDPQQRILLHIAYEAIEDAGLRLEDLQKCKTGVFVGAANLDYSSRVLTAENLANLDQFYSTGITSSILANRISFCLNLTGPSLTLDTACSSSLVALKIASQCLKTGECDVAIVCAPNIILDAYGQVVLSAGGLLAPDGRCKPFDAAGDGYGRGEGFAAVILKLKDDAVADKDSIYCEIVACGMNNDGQSAVPITAPSEETQAELFQRVLEESGLDAEDIEYLEAHGTGTAIGDVVEMKSIAKTYCSNASGNGRVLRVGSVKSNLNHTESVSGLAGLIKAALMLKNKTLVPTINVNTLNSKLKLTEKRLQVQDVCEPWVSHDDKPRIAALNSFGYGGSNVHAILQEHREIKCNSEKQSFRENLVLTLSAHSESALHDMAQQYVVWLKETPEHEERKSVICWSLNTRRSQFPHRLAVVFETLMEAAHLLELFGQNKTGWENHVAIGKALTQHLRTVFVFGGQGANWYGMGRQLVKCEPLFRQIISKISGVIQDLGETWSLENELLCQEHTSKLTGNIIGQPAIFAIQYATAKLLESWGITPAAVVGHSLGELAASCVAGVLTLDEALKIILVRSKCHELCSGDGCMAALGMSEEDASQLIIQLKLENGVSIAAINDGNSVTISGDRQSIECVKTHLSLNNMQVFWKDLLTTRAFHSFQVETVKEYFQSQMKSLHLHPQATTIPLYSTVTGNIISGKTMDENYWWCNFRQPVQFCKAVQNLLRDNYRMAIEISAQPTLGHYIRRIAEQVSLSPQSNDVVYLATHPRKSVEDQHKAFLHNTVGQLYTMGYSIDWALLQGEEDNFCYIPTPTYPWQKKDYWYKKDEPTMHLESVQSRHHAFLSNVKPRDNFTGLQCWEVEVDLYRFPYLTDHALIQGGHIFPGAAYVEMAIAMAIEKFCCDEVEVKNVQLSTILTIPENQVRLFQMQLQDGKDIDTADFLVKNISEDGSEIVLARADVTVVLGEGKMRQHSRGIKKGHLKSVQDRTEPEQLKEIKARMKPVALSKFRHLRKEFGFNYGPSFSLINKIWKGNEEAVCIIEVGSNEIKNEMDRYIVHPVILDACLQTSIAVHTDPDESETAATEATTFVPVRINRLLLLDRNIPERTFCHVSKIAQGNWISYDMNLMDFQGHILITIQGFQSAEMSTVIRPQKLENVAYETKWVESAIEIIEPRAKTETELRIVLIDSQGIGQSFSDLLRKEIPVENVITVDIPVTSGNFQETLVRAINSAISSAPTHCGKVQLINFLPLDAGLLQASYEAIDNSQTLCFVSSVKILQAIASGNFKNLHLVIVTKNAQVVISDEETCCFPWASSVLGLRRTASLEFVNIRCTTVDLGDEPLDLDLLAHEVQAVTSEDEIAFRRGQRFVNRISRLEDSSSVCATTLHKRDANPSIRIMLHPKTHRVCVKKTTWPNLSEDKVQVNVAFTWVVDRYIRNLFSDDSHVVGFSGQVCLAATNKAGIRIGDDVCGMINTSEVGNQVQVDADHVIRTPKDMTDAQAATLPVCLVIAFYVLRKTLGEEHKMHLVIDEPNSGLGLVTVLVAKALGHTVLDVSLGGPTKFAFPEMDPDNESICQKSFATKGQVSKVDVAIFLNTPKSKSIQNTYHLLKDGGKLVILKEDINSRITIPTSKKITVERIRFTEIVQKPHTLPKSWTSVQQVMLTAGLMDQVMQITQHTVNIFEYMHEANGESLQQFMSEYSTTVYQGFASLSFGHCGLWTEGSLEVLNPGIDQQGLKSDRTYMVVGGVRGFGFEVAKWMASSGAKTIVLVARSKPSESKLYEVSQLTRLTGANIILHQADASSSACMKSLQQRLQSLPSVAGIVHTAMVLKDELIPTLNVSSFMAVAAPKIKGAFLLHEMSLHMDLDFFVLFSSISSLLGSIGQASYAAANAFLDGLAQYRQHVLGLPAVSINWGPIKGAGVLQREEAIAEYLLRAGHYLLPTEQAIQCMEQVLLEYPDRAQLGVFDIDWHKIKESTLGLTKSTRLSNIINEGYLTEKAQDMQSLASRLLLEKDPRKQEEMAKRYVIELLCSWTGNTPSELDFNSSLYNYGMDSFSALTFKMRLESSLQISFEVFYFTQPDTTLTKMVQDIIARLSKSQIQNEPTLENASLETEPVANGCTQRRLSTEESVHPMDITSDSATYHLIPLFKPDQAEVRLFCIHPAGRYTMNLAPVSNGFTQQSLVAFYGIGYTEPLMRADNRSVRKLAESYTRMIKEIQRDGPYYLAGQSFGGLVAYEVANILTEQCEDVAFTAMIDTFPWYLANRTGDFRLEMIFRGGKVDNLIDRPFEALFEQVLSKLASSALDMTTEDYKEVREKNSLSDTIKFLQQTATDKNIPLYDITLLQDSLCHDIKMATQKHKEWKPPQVRFKGPLTYLKCADQSYTPARPFQGDADSQWALLVDGNIDVYICPGDHLSISDPQGGAIVGSILASAVSIRYRTLCPRLPRLPMSFKQRRGISKFEGGVSVVLHSKKASRRPHIGSMYLDVRSQTLTFRSIRQSLDSRKQKRNEKKIYIKELKIVLPGKYEPSAIKIASKTQETTKQRTVNLALITSVVTPKRAFNFEWHNFEDTKEFFSVIEAIMGVTIYKK